MGAKCLRTLRYKKTPGSHPSPCSPCWSGLYVACSRWYTGRGTCWSGRRPVCRALPALAQWTPAVTEAALPILPLPCPALRLQRAWQQGTTRAGSWPAIISREWFLYLNSIKIWWWICFPRGLIFGVIQYLTGQFSGHKFQVSNFPVALFHLAYMNLQTLSYW